MTNDERLGKEAKLLRRFSKYCGSIISRISV
jgi:hypothetical protein